MEDFTRARLIRRLRNEAARPATEAERSLMLTILSQAFERMEREVDICADSRMVCRVPAQTIQGLQIGRGNGLDS